MPQISKQRVTGNPVARPGASVAGVMGRIAPVKASADGIKFSLYGRSKTGKTRFACTFPKPLLLVGAEDGTKSIAGTPGVDFVRLQSSSELGEITQHLAIDPNYKTIVVDTATALRDMVMMEILGLNEIPIQKSWGMATRDQWGQGAVQVKERLRALFNLAERPDRRLNVVVIAQEQNFTEESRVDPELIMPSIGSALGKTLADWLNTAVDYVCHTYIREQVVINNQKVAGKDVGVRQSTGRREYCLRTGADPIYMTGFRMPTGGMQLPDCLVNPTFDQVAALIRGGK